MSQWTQVTGSIRIDSFHLDGKNGDDMVQLQIEKKMGKIVDFDSPREMQELPESETTPRGGEGGLEYQYVLNLDASSKYSSVNRGSILIQGSLRDYGGDDLGEYFSDNPGYKNILDWLNKSFAGELDSKNGFYIRQGVVQVEVQGGTKTGEYYYYYDEKARSFLEKK